MQVRYFAVYEIQKIIFSVVCLICIVGIIFSQQQVLDSSFSRYKIFSWKVNIKAAYRADIESIRKITPNVKESDIIKNQEFQYRLVAHDAGDIIFLHYKPIVSKATFLDGSSREASFESHERKIYFMNGEAIVYRESRLFAQNQTDCLVYKCTNKCINYPLLDTARVPLLPSDSIFLVFLIGHSPLSLYDYPVREKSRQNGKTVLVGNRRTSEKWIWRLFVNEKNIPVSFESSLDRGDGTLYHTKIETKRTIRIGEREWIKEFVYYAQGASTIEMNFQLDDFSNKSTIDIEVPIGTTVRDLRLAGDVEQLLDMSEEKIDEMSVFYSWSGRLPSEAELQQLAYQQGHLIPPDAPARRYSLWMFLPALLLFGLAGYLYYRQKRK